MASILVSLLSKYLQPNFLFIKEMSGKFDKLVFVSTEKMEAAPNNSTEYLCKALSIDKEEVGQIMVVEDDANDIKSKLISYNFSKDDTLLINLTGGTKVMSLSTYEYFRSFNAIRFFYIPEGKNEIRELYHSDVKQPLSYRLNLKEYFTINRISFTTNEEDMRDEDTANKLFDQLKENGFKKNKVAILRDAQRLEKREDKLYYDGIWFEEYIYYRLKKQLNLDSKSICQGAKIYKNKQDKNDNETDVMFIYNNELYIFECKHRLYNDIRSVEDYMYKLAAISKDYGLKVNSYIVTLQTKESILIKIDEENSKSKKSKYIDFEIIDNRKKILGIKNIFYAEDLKNNYLNLTM